MSTHVSREMRRLIAEREWLTVFLLPAYSPDLNPVEGCGPTSSAAWSTSPSSPSTAWKHSYATGPLGEDGRVDGGCVRRFGQPHPPHDSGKAFMLNPLQRNRGLLLR
ncbi:transposase [Streptomyces sp. NPDC002928]|uniref:transposase n=1 Tax=Streptomyces sp. NPDC002928 TaxID=3154440 RepID=UPI0033AF3353